MSAGILLNQPLTEPSTLQIQKKCTLLATLPELLTLPELGICTYMYYIYYSLSNASPCPDANRHLFTLTCTLGIHIHIIPIIHLKMK